MNRHFALGRMPAGQMNKTEAAYAQHLELLKRAGEAHWSGFEVFNIKLADRTYYKPDFFVMAKDGVLECHEVKGFWQDDARVKIKVAAAQIPIIRFKAIKLVRGSWAEEEF